MVWAVAIAKISACIKVEGREAGEDGTEEEGEEEAGE